MKLQKARLVKEITNIGQVELMCEQCMIEDETFIKELIRFQDFHVMVLQPKEDNDEIIGDVVLSSDMEHIDMDYDFTEKEWFHLYFTKLEHSWTLPLKHIELIDETQEVK